MGKGLDKGKLFVVGEVGEEGVWDAKVAGELAPVTPEFGPLLGSRSHDPMGKGLDKGKLFVVGQVEECRCTHPLEASSRRQC